MLITDKTRRAIYEAIFAEGVLVAYKDLFQERHYQVKVASNLQVIKAMTSLKSKGFVKEQFAWQHYYWTLTNEGIEHIRTYLGLPAEVIPKSLEKPAVAKRPMGAPTRSREGGDRGDRDAYRSRGAQSAEGKPTGDFNPTFRGGAGRGRGAPAQTQA